MMNQEEARAIIAKARATSARLRDFKVRERGAEHDWDLLPPKILYAQHSPEPAPEPESKQSPPAMMSEVQSARWNSWAMQVVEHAWRTHYQDAIAKFTAEFVQKV
jgi:hypothetical protein